MATATIPTHLPATATIRVAGFTLTAPTDLIIAANWTVCPDGTCVDQTSNGFAARRIIRALSEERVSSAMYPDGVIDEGRALILLARSVALGEIESLERRHNNARLEAARIEAETAKINLRAAELNLRAAELPAKR